MPRVSTAYSSPLRTEPIFCLRTSIPDIEKSRRRTSCRSEAKSTLVLPSALNMSACSVFFTGRIVPLCRRHSLRPFQASNLPYPHMLSPSDESSPVKSSVTDVLRIISFASSGVSSGSACSQRRASRRPWEPPSSFPA